LYHGIALGPYFHRFYTQAREPSVSPLMSEHIPTIPFPDSFERIADLISRAFGTSEIATRLLMLNAVGAALGNSHHIQTPNCQQFIPALNLGFVTRGDALIQGAQMSLLGPMLSMIQAAVEFRVHRGFRLYRRPAGIVTDRTSRARVSNCQWRARTGNLGQYSRGDPRGAGGRCRGNNEPRVYHWFQPHRPTPEAVGITSGVARTT